MPTIRGEAAGTRWRLASGPLIPLGRAKHPGQSSHVRLINPCRDIFNVTGFME